MACDTPSHSSDHLCLIWKEFVHNCRCYRADTACGTDGRTDKRTDGRSETSIPPQQLRCAGGIMMSKRPDHILSLGHNELMQKRCNSRTNAQKLRLFFKYVKSFSIFSLRPSDTIWQHRSSSTLVQVMGCCCQATTHYLNQCWLIVSDIQWQSPEGNFVRNTSVINW